MRQLKDIIRELLDLNMDMVKNQVVEDEYADRIIELKNDYERYLEEEDYLRNMRE